MQSKSVKKCPQTASASGFPRTNWVPDRLGYSPPLPPPNENFCRRQCFGFSGPFHTCLASDNVSRLNPLKAAELSDITLCDPGLTCIFNF